MSKRILSLTTLLFLSCSLFFSACQRSDSRQRLNDLLNSHHSLHTGNSAQKEETRRTTEAESKKKRSFAEEASLEMDKRIEKQLSALGTEEERKKLLEELANSSINIPDYLLERSVVDHFLFKNYLLASYKTYDEKIDSLDRKHKENIADPVAKKEEKKGLVAPQPGEERTITPEEFENQIEAHSSHNYLPAAFIADVLNITTPVDITDENLLRLAKSVRDHIKEPLREAVLNELKEELSSEDGRRAFSIPEDSEIEVIRGVRYLHQGEFVATTFFQIAPLVAEPPKALINREGEVEEPVHVENVISTPYINLHAPANRKRVSFYLKLLELPEQRLSREKLKERVLVESVYATSNWSYETTMRTLVRSGDWSFYPENLEESQ